MNYAIEVDRAIQTKSKLWIEYIDQLGEISNRIVHPLVLFSYRTSTGERNKYFTAYCELRNQYRTFRVDRVRLLMHINEIHQFDQYNELNELFCRFRPTDMRILRCIDSVDPSLRSGSYSEVAVEVERTQVDDKRGTAAHHSYSSLDDSYPRRWFSAKIPGGVGICRSPLEERVFEKLDKDAAVLCYEIEPLSIPYCGRTYIPDLLVTYDNSAKKLVEIKTIYEAGYDENQQKFNAADGLASNLGWVFEVWTMERQFIRTIDWRNLDSERNASTRIHPKVPKEKEKLDGSNAKIDDSREDGPGCTGLLLVLLWLIIMTIPLVA